MLAAVSGGGDSVALLLLLARHSGESGMSLTVAHVNHALRGADSDADERFVASLAARLGLPCVLLPGRPPASTPRPGEDLLRRIRRARLDEAARSAGCNRIALGHTLDDQAETILMRLVRGAGRRGLSGMSRAGPGRLIRPLLDLRRARLREWLQKIGEPFREDATNVDERFLRNRIRARVLPLLATMNPSIVEALARCGEVLAEEDRYLDERAAEWIAIEARRAAVPAARLAGLPLALSRRVAREMLREARPDPRAGTLAAVEAILDLARIGREGRERALPGGLTALVRGGDLVLKRTTQRPPGPPPGFDVTMPIPGRVALPGGCGAISARLEDAGAADPGSPFVARLDADRLGGTVRIRLRRPGDRFHPLGAPGPRRLKEFLIDRKVPRSARDRIPLVVGPAGIAWVTGHRIGHVYRLTSSTRRVAVLEYTPPVDLYSDERIY